MNVNIYWQLSIIYNNLGPLSLICASYLPVFLGLTQIIAPLIVSYF